MNTRQVSVEDKDGKVVKATMVVCPYCGSNEFILLQIEGHDHIQCAACDRTFCDGTCDTPGAKLTETK
jgi:transposase-like protein